ncbi:MAG: penicillin-binding protein 2 [Hyphomicrobiaceae bacterium]
MFSETAREDSESGARFTRRALVLTGLQAIGFGVLGARLYQLQVMEQNRFAPLAASNRHAAQVLAPIRGLIYDRSGRVLAENVESFRLIMTPSLAPDPGMVLSRIATLVPLDASERDKLLARIRRQSPNTRVVVLEDLTFEDIARVGVLSPQLPGIESEMVGRRRYHRGDAMGHLVGHVGGVTRLALDDDPVLRVAGFRVGRIGVEHALEHVLRGKRGHVRREVDARGRVVNELDRVEPERGLDVVLTVDTELQERVLAQLSRVKRGAAAVLKVDTGRVLALANWPSADVTELGDNVSRQRLQSLANRQDAALLDRTIRGLYPPGSTFKMVTALAGLEAGVVQLGEKIACEGTYHFHGQQYRCWNRRGHGPCDLHRALRESCDVYFYELARRLGIERLADMARRLGLGQVYDGLGLSFQAQGIVPTPAWKRSRFATNWFAGETLHAAIGQGYVSTTPLQLAVMTARLATGRVVTPTVIASAGEAAGVPTSLPGLDIAPGHLAAVQRAMRAVVHEQGGTGSRARHSGGIEVAGKTGTSQVTRLSAQRQNSLLRWNQRDHALFVAYWPARRPEFAMSLIVEHGGGGGTAAAPLARSIMETVTAFERDARPPFTLGGRDAGVERG